MRLFYKKNGAVSVFLAIILVPMIVLCCFFVDASRSKLVQSLISSSGDLAINSVLTQYDADLEDYYGMMASCQNIKEFYDVAEEFYYQSLVSRGVDLNEASLYAQIMKDITAGDMESVNDLLQIADAGDTKFEIKAMSDASNLANSQMLKKETVEFMKYRAPIEGARDIYERFASNKDSLENAKKDAEIIEKQSEYAESSSDVLKAANKAYKAIKKYEKVKITPQKVKEISSTLNSLEEEYKKLHVKMVKDLYNTQSLHQYPADPDGLYVNYDTKLDNVDGQTTEYYLNQTAKAMHEFVDAANHLNNVYQYLPAYAEATHYDIQYWVACDEILSQNNYYQEYVAKAKTLNKQYKLLEKKMTASDLTAESTISNYANCSVSGKDKNENHYDGLKKQYNKLNKEYFSNSNSAYNQIISSVGTISVNEAGRISTGESDKKIQEICSVLNGFYSDIEDADDALKDACKSLNELKDKVEQMRQDYDAWKDTVDKAGTDFAKEQQKRTETGSLKYEEKVVKSFENEDVDALINRLQNIRGLLGSIKTSIDGYKYNAYNGGKPKAIKDIDSYKSFRNHSNIESSKDKIVMEQTTLNDFATTSFVIQKDESVREIVVNDSNNPSLSVKTPTTYTTLKNLFEKDGEEKTDKDGKDKLKKEEKTAKDNIKDKEDENLMKAQEMLDKKDRISVKAGEDNVKISGDEEGRIAKKTGLNNISNATSGLLEGLGDAIGKGLEGARDSLYTTEYIMKMFSYDTYEKEAEYKYNNPQYGVGKTTGDFQADLASTNPEITFNKTLTNKVISRDNNYAYGSEVEYILYGGKNAKNKASAYASIFAIRFALNLLPEFQQNWDDDVRTAAGFAVVSIPPILIAVAMLIAQTAAGTVDDMNKLKAGEPVNLIHKQSEIQLVTGKIVNAEVDKKKAFFYSDYLSLFLFIKLSSSGKQDKVYLRMGDVIQANMQKNYDEAFQLKKSITYFRGTATMKVEALMLDIPLASGYMKQGEKRLGTIRYEEVRGY